MLYDILNEICEYRIKTNGITFNTASDEAENAKKLLSRLKYELINELSEQLFVNKIKVKISEGAGNFPLIWHVYLLPEKQKVSSGIYIATCFDKQGKGAVIGCAESKTNPQGLSTVTRKIKKIKFMGLDVDGIGKGTKYNNVFFNPVSFYYKENPTQEDEKRLKNHLLISINDTISILNHAKDNQSSSSSVDKMSIRSATNANIPSDIKFNDSLPKYITQSILSRRGQQKFRQNLISAYEGKCAVTQCSIQELLEAAHINPFSKSGNSGNITSNGILLRSDIHTLFDLGLLKITTDYKVEIADDLKGDPIYKVLNGTKLNLPKDKDHRPNIDKLRKKYIGEV